MPNKPEALAKQQHFISISPVTFNIGVSDSFVHRLLTQRLSLIRTRRRDTHPWHSFVGPRPFRTAIIVLRRGERPALLDGWPVTGTPPDGWPAGTMRGKDVLDVAKYPKVLYHGKGVKGAAGLQFEGTCFPLPSTAQHSGASALTPTPTKPLISTSLRVYLYSPPIPLHVFLHQRIYHEKLGTIVLFVQLCFYKKTRK